MNHPDLERSDLATLVMLCERKHQSFSIARIGDKWVTDTDITKLDRPEGHETIKAALISLIVDLDPIPNVAR